MVIVRSQVSKVFRPKCLLAKSSLTPDKPRAEEKLCGHTALVLSSAEQILETSASLSLEALGLKTDLLQRLQHIVQLSAFVHDLGKCSDHFQAMVMNKRQAPQLMRHEAALLWLAWPGQTLANWLLSAVGGNERDYLLAIIAAVAHHRKFWAHALASKDSGAGTSLCLLTSHADFKMVLDFGRAKLKLAEPPSFATDTIIERTPRRNLEHQFEEWQGKAEEQISRDSLDAILLGLAKVLVICSDVAGSALPKSGECANWVASKLRRGPPANTYQHIIEARLNGGTLRGFQSAIAASKAPVTLVRAGCGSGKTLAAYAWAGEQNPERRLWVTYPTTGTTTEGFRDYLVEPDIDSRLEHSRAQVDIELLELPTDDGIERTYDRLSAIRSWSVDVVACTVDTVLGLFQNQRKGLYAWPSLCRSAVVFDEIHAYDNRLFATLLRFLKSVPGVPVLLMTASLPQQRLCALQKVVHKVHGMPLVEIAGPADLETLPRYRRMLEGDPFQLVAKVMRDGGKVLWVCNTVSGCLDVADQLCDFRPLVYHSRFRYRDRIQRHADVVGAFGKPGPTMAVTTQVAEMSLDLSADLLVTDLAPIPALIQRLGRLNRRSHPDSPQPIKPFYVIPFKGLPYDQQDLASAEDWLNRLGIGNLSQRDLANAWQESDSGTISPIDSAWLDGVFITEPSQTRDAAPGICIVLSQDVLDIRNRIVPIIEVIVPMLLPHKLMQKYHEWERVSGFPVPPDAMIAYDPMRGARWVRQA
ncbi:MAG: CRISPR-associated helicase Cas3' [Cyanobacteria bacterium NC_groundwater_1444_Ag_S-0.65um_54_12]|nr:CRISPR-associated helicase Cas3' [Cyanobacteria bacterium NC_groundwater_1444_Ag_S-0.65um_54_12]